MKHVPKKKEISLNHSLSLADRVLEFKTNQSVRLELTESSREFRHPGTLSALKVTLLTLGNFTEASKVKNPSLCGPGLSNRINGIKSRPEYERGLRKETESLVEGTLARIGNRRLKSWSNRISGTEFNESRRALCTHSLLNRLDSFAESGDNPQQNIPESLASGPYILLMRPHSDCNFHLASSLREEISSFPPVQDNFKPFLIMVVSV